MSSTLFINFLKSFVGRFGIRTKVVSDNFRSFKSGETRNYFEFSIPWNSILEKSPWWGVFYEPVYQSSEKLLVQQNLAFTNWIVIVQIENMLKRTPLTYLLNENVEEHITPSHLMYGRNINQCIVAADTLQILINIRSNSY